MSKKVTVNSFAELGSLLNVEPTVPFSHSDYENSTYLIISRVAYLIGVPKKIFENEHEPPQLEIYRELEKDRNARIIRNLCMLRTAIEQNYKKINDQMYYDVKNLHSLPDLVPQESLRGLMADGIEIEKSNYKLTQYLIDINRYITNYINNCKGLFPIWVEWDYIKKLFIMPNGLNEHGLKAAAVDYYSNKNGYPYQVYINWPYAKAGNILYNDKKFVTLLYEANEDYFTDVSKVSDAGNITKDGIYQFLEESDKVAIVVDCENSDPYKLYATLNNLNQAALLGKIAKIILYDDVHTTSAWAILDQFTEIPVVHKVIDRVKQGKSLVDITLTADTVRERYQNDITAFILVSSDSDYWGMIQTMPDTRFLVMVESMKCGPDIKNALENAGIMYCYIDDFCTGNSNKIKVAVMLKELRAYLERNIQINVNDMLDEVYRTTRAEMSAAEERQFYNKYIKSMRLSIAEDGQLKILVDE
ncbi:MAG: NYN domain-containing protein [Oscillospiraceae bacterium]|nr:NYN domain-containing protein [Oscillospiraceae bacterium]